MKINFQNKIIKIIFAAAVALEGASLVFDFSFAQVAGLASVPKKLDVSALILNNENKIIANGDYDVRFSIYQTDRTDNTQGEGTALWQETQKATIYNGILHTFLGTTTALPNINFSAGEYYVGIKIGTDSEMVPRKRVGAVPLALDSFSVGGATVGASEGNILKLGAGGKVDIASLPTGTSGKKLVLASDSRLSGGKVTVSGQSYITASGMKLTLKQISLASNVSGILPVANGGTGISSYTAGDMIYASASTTLSRLTIGANGKVLTVSGGLPSWQDAVGGGGNNFGTISVAGQSDVVADAVNDTLTFVAGTNISIATSAIGDSITLNATDTNTTYTAAAAPNLLQLSGTEFSVKQGTMTDTRICTYDATDGLVCNTLSGGVGTNYWQRNGTYLSPATIGDSVGIGFTAPGSKLTVSGGLSVGTTSASSIYLTAVAPDGGALFEGNVGIGTTNPSAALEVNGAILGSSYFAGIATSSTNFRATSGTSPIFFENSSGTKVANLDTAYTASSISVNSSGNLSVGAGTTTINQTETAGLTTGASSGQKNVYVNSSTGLSVGDLVLIIQMKGGLGVGTYEQRIVTNVISSTRIIVDANLTNSYTQTTNGRCIAADANCYQVVKVPRYGTVSVATGGTLTAPAWNSTTGVGGVLWFDATGAVTVNSGGSISMDGKGWTGGTGGTGGAGGPTFHTPGSIGNSGNIGEGPNAGSGGLIGGSFGTVTGASSGGGAGGTGGGGGGAGYLVAGTAGTNGVSGAGGDGDAAPGTGGSGGVGVGGTGGSSLSVSFNSAVPMGSGGGGGAGGHGGAAGWMVGVTGGNGGNGGTGGTGGGILVVHSADSISNSGTISANGLIGDNGASGQSGTACSGGGSGAAGGGGGAGGSVWLNSSSITSGTATVTGGGASTGGNGGNGTAGTYGCNGGGGAGVVGGSASGGTSQPGANASPGPGGSGSAGKLDTSTSSSLYSGGTSSNIALFNTGGLNLLSGLGQYTQIYEGDNASAFSITANSLASGKGINLTSTSTLLSGALGEFTLSGDDAGNTGSVLSLINSGTANTGNTLYIKNYSAGASLRIDDVLNDTTPFLIDANGYVGIGLTTPTALLTLGASNTARASLNLLSGTAPASPNNGDLWYDGTGLYFRSGGASTNILSALPAGSEGQLMYNNAGTWTAFSGMFWNDTNNRMGLGYTAPGSKLTISGGLSIGTTSSSSSYLTKMAPDGGAIFEGSVGIGTTNPTHKLQVNDNSYITDSVTQAQLFIKNAYSSGGGHASLVLDKGSSTDTAAFGFLSAGTSMWDAGIIDSNSFIIRDTLNNKKIFAIEQNAPSGTFYIKSSGYTGIGTTNPTGLLHVQSSTAGDNTFKVSNNSGYGLAIGPWTTNTNNVNLEVLSANGNVHVGRDVALGNWTFESGKVGIGFTSPGSKLTISGGLAVGTTSASSTYLTKLAPDGGAIFEGNVGIGTTDPGTYKLNVNGSLNVGTTATAASYCLGGTCISAWGSAGTNYWQRNGTYVSPATIGDSVGIGYTAPGSKLTVSGGLAVGTTSASSVYLTTAAPDGGAIFEGNVGIGTTNPSFKLAVAGDIGPSADNVYSLGSADYRFKDLYLGPTSVHMYNTYTDINNYEQGFFGYEGTSTVDSSLSYNTADETDYTQEDFAYSTTMTPSGTAGEVTLTLGSGNWNDNANVKAGMRVSGNGGIATLLADGAAQSTVAAFVETSFGSTAAITAGSWAMYGTEFPSNTVSLNVYGTAGYSSDLCTNTANYIESGHYLAGWEGDKAFDNEVSLGHIWGVSGSSGWIGYNFGTGRVISEYTIQFRSDGYTDQAPRTWTFEGYNGASWVTLDTRTAQPAWSAGEKRTYTFSNGTAYTQYRINITANQGGLATMIGEVEMMEYYGYPTSYATVSTSDTNQINSSDWTGITDISATETLNSQEIDYSVSVDDRATWKIYDSTPGDTGWRPVARNNGGTWQYNSNSTAGATDITWTNSTTNSQNAAISQAMSVAANKMSGTNMSVVTQTQWDSVFSAGTLDISASLKTSSTGTAPSLDQITISYLGGPSTGILTLGTKALGTGTVRDFQLKTGENVALYMESNGTIGIGMTSPTYNLQVAGTLGVGGTAYFGGNVGIGFTSPGSKLAISGGLAVGTTSASSTYLTKLAPDGGAIFEGNVGIGTTSPATTLDIWNHGDTASVQAMIIRGNDRATAADNDEAKISLYLDDDTGASVEYAKINWTASDVTNTSKDSMIEFYTLYNNSYTNRLQIGAQGVDVNGYLDVTGQTLATSAPRALLGAAAGATKMWLGNSTTTITLNNSASGLLISPNFTEAASGTHPIVTALGIRQGTITAGNASVTDTAQIYIEDAMNATVMGQNYAIWVDSGLSRFDGSVGIGTSNSGSKLTISGGLSVGTTSATSTYLTTLAPDGGAIFEGNVGIGTTNPTNQFSINSPTTSDGLATMLLTINSSSKKGLVIQGAASQGANVQEWQQSSGALLASVDSVGKFFSFTPIMLDPSYSNAGGTGDRRASITLTTNLTTAIGNPTSMIDGSTAMAYYWSNAQSVTDKYIQFDFGSQKRITEAKLYQSNNASHGIWIWQGSNNASDWTSIGDSFTFGGAIEQTMSSLSGNASYYRYYRLSGVSGQTGLGWEEEIEFKLDGVGSSSSSVFSGSGVGIGTTAPVGLLDVNSKFNVLSSGLVGIGYTAPGSKLTISGGLAVGTTSASSTYLTKLAPDGGAIFEGNVGIGTTTPGYVLDVVGDANITGNYLINGSAISANYWLGAGSNIYSNTTNVGIGFTSPGSKLTISGGISVGTTSASSIYLTSLAPDGGALFEGRVGIGATNPQNKLDVGGNAVVGMSYAGVKTAPANGLLVEGNVGIGTTSPRAKLEVSGTLSYSIGVTFAGSSGVNAAWNTNFPGQSINTSILTDGAIVSNGSIFNASDRRLKKNIGSIETDLANQFLDSVDPVHYQWKSDGSVDSGFIAQELIASGFGYMVSAVPDSTMQADNTNGFHSPAGAHFIVKYDSIIPLLTAAIKGQRNQIRELADLQSQQVDGLSAIHGILEDQAQDIAGQSQDIASLQNSANSSASQISALQQQLADQNISATDKINLIGTEISSIKIGQSSAENRVTALETKAIDLEEQMALLEEKTQAILDLADALEASRVIYKDEFGNVNILGGTLEAEGVVAGAFTIKIADKENKTIGQNYIAAVKKDDDLDGFDDNDPTTDGKSYFIKTKAVTATSKIFVTPQGDVGGTVWVEKQIDSEGNYTGFIVRCSVPVKRDTKIDWFIVEEK